MSLIKCPECEKDVSNKATYCPQCGFPLSKVVRINKVKAHTISGKKYICNIFSSTITVIKNFFESTIGVYLLVVLFGISLIAAALLAIWLLEQFAQINLITCLIAIIAVVIVANIGGYFFLYRDSSKWVKVILWCDFIMEIFVGIELVFAWLN